MSEPTSAQEVARLQDELQTARAALGDFAHAVSHDLRASLRHILSYAALLREEAGGALAGDAATYLETLEGASRTLAQQIDGLMAWSQLDRAELQYQELDLLVLISEAQAQLAQQCAGRDIAWQLPQQAPRLQGDAALLRQLFAHLLSNALKFTRGRETAVIAVSAIALSEGQVAVEVRDNGAGFDSKRQQRLFHVFQRLHGSSQFEGLGLGLALSRKIVERHGGSIAVEGALDAGCCVRLRLPAAGQY